MAKRTKNDVFRIVAIDHITYTPDNELVLSLYKRYKNIGTVADLLIEYWGKNNIAFTGTRQGVVNKIKALRVSYDKIGKNVNSKKINMKKRASEEARFRKKMKEVFFVAGRPRAPEPVNSESMEEGQSSSSQKSSASEMREFDEPETPQAPRKKEKVSDVKLLLHDNKLLSNEAVADLLQSDVSQKLYPTTVKRWRERAREERAKGLLKEAATLGPPVGVHFDGKSLIDLDCLTPKGPRHERLAVLISGKDKSILIGAAKLNDGKGKTVGNCVNEKVDKIEPRPKIHYATFDTCAVNTSDDIGALTTIEDNNGNLLNNGCRHHIYELPLGAIIDHRYGKSSSPEVDAFVRFKKEWEKISVGKLVVNIGKTYKKYKSDYTDAKTIIDFCQHQISLHHVRDDYKELIDLILLFFGENKNYKIKKPGNISRARWLQKGIYALKMFLLRKMLKLNNNDVEKLWSVILMTTKFYIFGFYTANVSVMAPNVDLTLLKKCLVVKDEDVTAAFYKKMSKQGWYLSPELVCLALFDEYVPLDVKAKMARKILSNENHQAGRIKRGVIPVINEIGDISLDYFCDARSLEFFKILELEYNFLKVHPSTWSNNAEYIRAKEIAMQLKTTNDLSERACALMDAVNRKVTRDYEQYEYICMNKYSWQQQQ